MTMKPLRQAVIFAVVAAMFGCGGRIWVDEGSPEGVRLHWYTRETSIDAATREAAQHCRSWGKDAWLTQEFVDTDVTVARFACR